MPCYTPPPTPEEERAYWEKALRHNSQVAEMLCTMCKTYLNMPDCELPDSVVGWWAEHKKRDDEKARAESRQRELANLKREGLAKLTPAERKALGLK